MKMKKGNRAFTILEVIASVTIMVIVMGGVTWKIMSLNTYADRSQAIHRAAMLSTAKQAYLREFGLDGENRYKAASSNEEKFNLVKHYLPYSGSNSSLKGYTPKGFKYHMNALYAKVGVFEENQEIQY